MAAHKPGAPSLITSTGWVARPRATIDSKKATQASVDSADTPSRWTNTGLPSVVMP
jgi:hypothetical protein